MNPIIFFRMTAYMLLLGFCGSVSAEIWEQKALLWKAERPGVEPNFVLGTIHSEDPRVTTLQPQIAEAFSASKAFASEIDIADSAEQMVLMQLPEGKSLEGMLGQGLYKKVMTACVDFGLVEMMCRQFTPWGIALTISMPRPKTGLFLDLMLYFNAKTAGKQVMGLEKVSESVTVFLEMSDEENVRFLRETVEQLDKKDSMLAKMHEVYVNRDLPGLAKMTHAEMKKMDSELARKLMQGLIYDRNIRFVENSRSAMQTGGLFMAVGAMHLAGEKGVLSLLQQNGWTLSPIY